MTSSSTTGGASGGGGGVAKEVDGVGSNRDRARAKPARVEWGQFKRPGSERRTRFGEPRKETPKEKRTTGSKEPSEKDAQHLVSLKEAKRSPESLSDRFVPVHRQVASSFSRLRCDSRRIGHGTHPPHPLVLALKLAAAVFSSSSSSDGSRPREPRRPLELGRSVPIGRKEPREARSRGWGRVAQEGFELREVQVERVEVG